MRIPLIRGAAISLMLITVAGCSLTDPYERAGMWRPRGVNDGNLAVLVADPHDLVSGKESSVNDGILAAMAVDRLHHDKAKPLPNATISSIAGNSTAQSTSPSSGSE